MFSHAFETLYSFFEVFMTGEKNDHAQSFSLIKNFLESVKIIFF